MSDSEAARRAEGFTVASVPGYYEEILAPAIFEPWAEVLVRLAGIAPGDRVLDVASGTGVVARCAARAAGGEGRVVASELSPVMLARSAAHPPDEAAAPIEFLESAADALPVEPESFDIVLCQQGLQFFPDKPAALAAIHRALRPGGVFALAVWAAGHRMEPFADYGDALAACGLQEPFAGAFRPGSFQLSGYEVSRLLDDAGFTSVTTEVDELMAVWPDVATVVSGIHGTPFGPLVAELEPEQREAVDAELARRFESADGPVARETIALLARGERAAA